MTTQFRFSPTREPAVLKLFVGAFTEALPLVLNLASGRKSTAACNCTAPVRRREASVSGAESDG